MIIQNLSLAFNLQLIFDNVTLSIREKEKVGIIGLNGAGKSTLFNLILGKIEPVSGRIILPQGARISLLPQVIDEELPSSDISVFQYLLSGRPIEELETEVISKYEEIANSTNEKKQNKILKEIANLENMLDYYERYEAENILLSIIDGMKIDPRLLEAKLKNLSGGQKSKVAFARLLYSKPEIILLDEPTNHLDKETKDYVINFLKEYHGSVYVISHDIDFLNSVTTNTLFIDKRIHKMELFNGNYNYFKKVSEAKDESLKNQAKIQEREEKKLRDVVLLYSHSSGKRKRMAQDREKKLEKLQENKIVILDKVKSAKVNVSMNRESSHTPLTVKNLTFKYNEVSPILINDLSFNLSKGEKFLIVGKNGVGKSTLLKLIAGQLIANSGDISFGYNTDIGYYAQEHELLDNSKTILENFENSGYSIKQIRTTLGNFLFTGDDVYKKIEVLSPGEKSRVALAKLSLIGANFLILDEPTNHLDPETQKIIGQTFKTFKGTMLVVSHNPDFVDILGISRTLNLHTGEISHYDKDIVLYYEKVNNSDKNNINNKKH